jgi:hypothetical protein
VHPGYLVDDPEGYSPELQSELRHFEDKLDLWLVEGAERFHRDPELMQSLLTLARHDHTRECLLLLESILETPGLMPRLSEVLRPKNREQGTATPSSKDRSPGTPVATPASKDRSPGTPVGNREQGTGNREPAAVGRLQQGPKARGRKDEA